MQLFTIGLVRINMDGTSVLQPNGTPEETYSQDDIVSYARAWTGFIQARERGGASSGSDGDHSDETSLDPMWIEIEKRDLFPKTNLIGGFIVSLNLIVNHNETSFTVTHSYNIYSYCFFTHREIKLLSVLIFQQSTFFVRVQLTNF